MTKLVLNLDERILKPSVSGANVELDALTDDEIVPTGKELDLDFLKLIGSSVSDKRQVETASINTMLAISSLAKDMTYVVNIALLEANKILEDTTRDLETFAPLGRVRLLSFSPSSISTRSGFFGSIKNAVNAVKNVVTVAKNGISNFLNTINPFTNGSGLLGSIAALAKFIACPEQSFLSDIVNAVSSVKDSIKGIKDGFNNSINNIKNSINDSVNNIKNSITGQINAVKDDFKNGVNAINKFVTVNLNPKNLLNNALKGLTEHINNRFPVINGLVSAFSMIRDYFKTEGADRSGALKEVESVLANHGLNMDYFAQLESIGLDTELLNPNNPIYTSDLNLPSGLPVETVSNKCSALGKIIAQLEASYRSENRFDDIITDDSILQYITDPDLKRVVENMLGVSDVSGLYYDANLSAEKLGYHNKTALNASFSTAINNAIYTDAMLETLDQVGEDPLSFESAKIQVMTQSEYLIGINNVTTQRLLAFEEGLKNIKRENDFYDISPILGALA